MDIKIKQTITITINGKPEEISEKQARELYEQLDMIFGQRAPNPWMVPYYPPPIEPFDNPSPWTAPLTVPWVDKWRPTPPIWCKLPEMVCQLQNTIS